MKLFLKFLAVAVTIAIIVATTYYLVQYNKAFVENNPKQSSNEEADTDNGNIDIKDVTPESKENIEKIAKEEKESLISVIKSTINLNTIANVRNTSNKTIPKSYYGEIVLNSYDDSGEEGSGEKETVQLPDTIRCTIQIAGSMINIVPDDDNLDSIEFHYRGDNKLVAYIRKYAKTSIKATYYFENGELLDKEINSFDQKYSVFESAEDILKRANEIYNAFLKEE